MVERKNKTGLVIRLLISLVLLTVVFSFVDLEQLQDVISRIDYLFFFVVIFLTFIDRLIMAYNWRRLILIKKLGLSFGTALTTYLKAGFVGMIFPTGIGADIYRIHYTSKLLGGLRHVASSVVIERLLGMMASTVFAASGVVLMSIASTESKFDEKILVQIFMVLAVLNILFFISMTGKFFRLVNSLLEKIGNYKIASKIQSFHHAYQEYGNYRYALLVFFTLSFVEQSFFVFITYFSALAINIHIEWFYFIGILPICQILKRIPISINSIGVQEGVFAYFFTQVGMSVTEAVSLSLLVRFAQWIIFFIGGILYVLDPKGKDNFKSLQSKT